MIQSTSPVTEAATPKMALDIHDILKFCPTAIPFC